MDDPLDREIDAAEALGRQSLEHAPQAQAASFDTVRRRIVVELADGRGYAFLPRLVEDLADADPSDLEEIVVDGSGLNLCWLRLEVDLLVPDLIAGVFGTKAGWNAAHRLPPARLRPDSARAAGLWWRSSLRLTPRSQ